MQDRHSQFWFAELITGGCIASSQGQPLLPGGCVAALGEESTRGHYRNFGCSPLLALPPLQCHTHFVHEFGRRVSMAYGANGSGKSALLQVRA